MMAEKAKPKAEPNAGQENAPAAKKPKKKLVFGAFGGLFVVLGVIVVITKMSGMGADEAAAQEALAQAPEEKPPVYQEIELAQIKSPNEKSSQMFVYELQVAARVTEENLPLAEDFLAHRRFAIEDAFNQVIRKADPEELKEHDLEWLRAQLFQELKRIAKDDELFTELYIPRFMKYRAD